MKIGKIKSYYINEGRNFDISDEDRKIILDAGFKFYTKYNGFREGDTITLFKVNVDNAVVDLNSVTFSYDSDIFVH